MDDFKAFLETSTIGGLNYISTTRTYVRYFWILVVVTSFTISFIEIWNLFHDWSLNPIRTTSENHPITSLTLPNITICPTKNSFLNLNYDVWQSEKVKLDDETREELLKYSIQLSHDLFQEEFMKNMSKVEYPDRYKHWYQGYTKVNYPYFFDAYEIWDAVIVEKQLMYYIYTSAPSGNISSQYFKSLFDPEKLVRGIVLGLVIHPKFFPGEQMDGNKTITFDLDRISMETEFEKMDFVGNSSKISLKWLIVAIFLKWQECSVVIWLDIAEILHWR